MARGEGAAKAAPDITARQELAALQASHGIAAPMAYQAGDDDEDAENSPTAQGTDPCWYAIHPLDPPALWPCHVGGYRLYSAMRTQWRTGMAGATGLDYGPWRSLATDVLALEPGALSEAFWAMQAFEHAQLERWDDQRRLQEARDKARNGKG